MPIIAFPIHHMPTKFIATICLVLFSCISNAQTEKKKKGANGYLYLTWGYNKDWFSRSDIHFKGTDYDFTIYDVTAKDRPEWDQLFAKNISIPQFVYRVGYNFGKGSDWGIEVSFDHAKYIMENDQVAHVEGRIHESYVNQDTTLTKNFVRFEHTNGANFLMFNVFKRSNVFLSKNGYHGIIWILKPGAGIVVPQSSVALFNVNQDNNYHVAGYIVGIDSEFRYEYKHGLFAESGLKYSFANYTNVLAVGDSKANHHFTCLEWIVGIGYSFAL
jgi:hypothetical protein